MHNFTYTEEMLLTRLYEGSEEKQQSFMQVRKQKHLKKM